MKIHRAGHRIILTTILSMIILIAALHAIWGSMYATLIVGISEFALLVFILRFFRVPKRQVNGDEGILVAPADGTIVAIEEVYEDEFLKKKALQISIFMSVWNVHINWFPCKGIMKTFHYHPGKFLIARHPKSSTLNERTSVLMETAGRVQIVIRQIAGIVARRIENYVTDENTNVEAGQEMGFIKFGSRVDVFLPIGTEPMVAMGQTVKGKMTQIAQLPDMNHFS